MLQSPPTLSMATPLRFTFSSNVLSLALGALVHRQRARTHASRIYQSLLRL